VDPSALGFDPAQARTLDLLKLLRNTQGPDITSAANYYGIRTARNPAATIS
jgi:hypothetical protein